MAEIHGPMVEWQLMRGSHAVFAITVSVCFLGPVLEHARSELPKRLFPFTKQAGRHIAHDARSQQAMSHSKHEPSKREHHKREHGMRVT
jgi:hypothetical protein